RFAPRLPLATSPAPPRHASIIQESRAAIACLPSASQKRFSSFSDILAGHRQSVAPTGACVSCLGAPRRRLDRDLTPDLDHLVVRKAEEIADMLRIALHQRKQPLLPGRQALAVFSRDHGFM